MVVEAVPFVEPAPGVTAQLTERRSLDEVEGVGAVELLFSVVQAVAVGVGAVDDVVRAIERIRVVNEHLKAVARAVNGDFVTVSLKASRSRAV